MNKILNDDGFLKSHPELEIQLGLDVNHCIVNVEDWNKIRNKIYKHVKLDNQLKPGGKSVSLTDSEILEIVKEWIDDLCLKGTQAVTVDQLIGRVYPDEEDDSPCNCEMCSGCHEHEEDGNTLEDKEDRSEEILKRIAQLEKIHNINN